MNGSPRQPDRALRLCLVSRAPFFGGAEQAGLRLASGLVQAGHMVRLILGHENIVARKMRDAGLDVTVTPLPQTDKQHWWSYRWARGRLRQLLRDFQPDIVHANDLPTHQIASDAARGLGAGRVCHQRFLYSGQAIDWLNKHGADLHLFISPAFADEMCRRSPKLAGQPRALVPDGLPMPPRPRSPDRFAARRELDLPLDRALVTFTGQVIERKGIADLLTAWKVLPRQQRHTAQLLIVGDDLAGHGQYRRTMERLAESMGVGAIFAGFRTDVERWLIASNIVALPSHDEPLGLTIMEAMAYGRACVGSDTGGIPSMITHEKTGLLVRPRDPQDLSEAIGRLLFDHHLRRRLGREARRRCAEQFSIEAHVTHVLGQYARLLERAELRRTA